MALVFLGKPASMLAQHTPLPLPNPDHIPLSGPVHLQAENVTVHVMDGVHLNVYSVDALLLTTRNHPRVVLDDPNSMKILIQSADTSLTAKDMTILINNYALPHSHLPIHDLDIAFVDGGVQIKGKLHKVVDLPFSAVASLSVTPDGDVHLHFTKITAIGFIHKGLLDFLGMNIADIAKSNRNKTFRVTGDSVTFPIHALFPAPHFSGRLKKATIQGQSLVQIFGEPGPFPPPPVPAKHYIYFRGGALDFARLSMLAVDLELIDKDGDRPFEFSLQNVFLQALPGYFKNRPNRGMTAYIDSYHDKPSDQK